MQSIAPALRVIDAHGVHAPWDALPNDYELPDVPVWDPDVVGAYERTPRALPIFLPLPYPQTPALAPDSSLASPELLTLSEGSLAPAAPNFQSYYNAADAATDDLWLGPDMLPAAANDFVEPERRSRSRTRTPPALRARRRRTAKSAPTHPAPLSSIGSPDILLSPPSPISPYFGPRSGRPLAHDADVSPLRLPAAGASSSALAGSATSTVHGPIAHGPPVGMKRTHRRRRWSDGDSYDADEGEEDWSLLLAVPPAATTSTSVSR